MPITLANEVLDIICQKCTIKTLATVSCVSFRARDLALPHLMRAVCLNKSRQQFVIFFDLIIQNTKISTSRTSEGLGKLVFELELGGLAIWDSEFIDNETYDHHDDEIYDHENDTSEDERDTIPMWQLAPMLTNALRLMPNLRMFALGDKAEGFATYSPDIGQVLLGNPRLTSLTLAGIRQKASLCFAGAKAVSLLKKLHLSGDSFSEVDTDELDIVPYEGVGQLLCHNSMSMNLTDLTIIEMSLITFLPENGNQRNEGNNGRITFPAVNRLHIGNCEVYLEALAVAFPALKTLLIDLSITISISPNTDSENHITFPKLTSVEGLYEGIYQVLEFNASQDSIRRTVVLSEWGHSADMSLYHFAVPAPHLKSIHYYFQNGSIHPFSWWRSFAESQSGLLFLSLRPHVGSKDDFDSIYRMIPSALSPMPLQYISLCIIDGGARVINPNGDFENASEEEIALEYATCIRTLKYIDVSKGNFPLICFVIIRDATLDSNNSAQVPVRVVSVAADKVWRDRHDSYDM